MVDVARRAFGTRRVGHAGTLDPFATGLLPLLVGRATRLMQYVVGLSKRYAGTIRLGERTDTDDLTGTVLASDDRWRAVTDEDLEQATRTHTGRILQRPPAFSAKKVAGQRAYRRAQRGEPLNLEPREVEVLLFEITARSGRDCDFVAEVGSGTYIRSLARDVGEALGCGAHLHALRRLAVGRWDVAAALPLSALRAGTARLEPPAGLVAHLPRHTVTPEERDLVRHGRPLPATTEDTGPVALLAGDTLVAVAESVGGMLKPRVVLEGE